MADLVFSSLFGSLVKLPRRQTVGNNTVQCAPGATNTSLANCNNLNNALDQCNTLANQNAPKQDIINCFCTQQVLSDYVGCKNDLRLCTLSDIYDSDFDKMISDWSNTCTPYLTATTITTPAAVSLTQTYDEQACSSLLVSCEHMDSTYSSCSSSFTQATDLSSCLCASSVLSLASQCQIDGALQCEMSTPDPSTLWGARFCSATPAIPSNTPPGTATTTAPPNTTWTSGAPPISFGPGPTLTSSIHSAGDANVVAPGLLAVLAWFTIITWFVGR